MKRDLSAILVAAILIPCASTRGNPVPATRLPTGRDVFLMENDFVYARFLQLGRDGTYRQINRDPEHSAEVDRGTWEQDRAGALRLHSRCRALRPRALLCGPLSVVIADQENLEKLPALFASIRVFLAGTFDAVFDAKEAMNAGGSNPPGIVVAADATTFGRTDLEKLAAEIQDILRSEHDGIYELIPVSESSPPLFALRGSVMQAGDVARVRGEYKVPRGEAPPFYFAWVEARTFAREVGRWQPLHLPGGVE